MRHFGIAVDLFLLMLSFRSAIHARHYKYKSARKHHHSNITCCSVKSVCLKSLKMTETVEKKAGASTKAKKSTQPRAPAAHPKYAEMIVSAVTTLKERGGSSRQAILKYIMDHYNVGKDEKTVNTHLKMALRRGVTSGLLNQSKGTGASGSFKAGEKSKAAAKPKAKKATAKKPTKKDAKKSTKKASKSPSKKQKPVKKTAAKKSSSAKSKKAAKPKPKTKKPKATKAAKPKKAKTPTKKAGKAKAKK